MTEAELPIYVLIWTACAVVAWFIANTKKAPDAGMWGFWGLLLGPLGILGAIAFAKPGTTNPISGRLCGRCAKPLSPAWSRCQHCGAAFAEFPPV